VSNLPSTKDAALDFAAEAGPRIFAELPTDVRKEVVVVSPNYKATLKRMAQWQWARIKWDVERTCIENRIIEKESKATHTFLPYCRFPISMVAAFEAIWGEGCLQNEEFREDTLKHHPGLRLHIKRGIRGQEYLRST